MSELKKNKNAGFSLIEVLIAMAIFAICLIPLLRSFVVVSRTNAKSRQTLNASTLAENVIEQIKSEGVAAYVGTDTPSGYKTIDGVNYPIYTLSYSNRTFDDRTYSMQVTLTPSTETYNDAGTEKELNAQKTAELFTMSNRTDAFYVEDTNVLNSAAQLYVDSHSGVTLSEVKQNMETQYTFVISNAGGIQSVEQTVSRTYSGNLVGTAETASIFSSLQTGNELKSLYIFYVPAASGAKETFIIENKDNYPLDVYIVQQKAGSSVFNKKVRALTVVEQTKTDVNAPTTIRTNLALSDFNQITYQHDGSVMDSMNSVTAPKAFGFYELGVDENMVGKVARLYDISVTVADYNGDELVTLTGTALR